jgi:hypothetical protein
MDEQNLRKLEAIKQSLRKPHGQDRSRAKISRTRFLPGERLSVELGHCHHRVRLEAHASGYPPRRAQCPHCRRWRDTIPGTARKPRPNKTSAVVGERVEERDGRLFTVKVLRTPRRARLALDADLDADFERAVELDDALDEVLVDKSSSIGEAGEATS